MSLKNVAQETLKIIQAGQYINNSGRVINFALEQKNAEANTKLYTPEQLSNLFNRHRSLLLGAWGCGVFRNNPDLVADAFLQWLHAPEFQGCFDRVVFAVYDPSKEQKTLKAFQNRLKHPKLATDLKEELNINNPPLPPWLKHPELERYSLGWRMGYGEYYRDIWWLWSESQNNADLVDYFKKFTPIPLEWADWVASLLFGDDLEDRHDENDMELLIKKLEQVGLINFNEWTERYSHEA